MASQYEQYIGFNDIRVVDNVKENLLQIFLPGKPYAGLRKNLKRAGFRKSRTTGAWQRQRSIAVLYWVLRICGADTEALKRRS